MTDHTVKVSVDDDIASIILDRGEVRNALNRDTMAQLRDAALAVSDKDQVRAVIIRAQGTDFSVGADLKEVSVLKPEGSLLRARRDAELGQKLLTAIREIHQPTICAVVNGPCTAPSRPWYSQRAATAAPPLLPPLPPPSRCRNVPRAAPLA